MELDEELALGFAEAGLACFDLSGLAIDQGRSLRAMVAEYRDNFADLDEDEVKERRWRNCAIPGTRPEDFAEHIVDLGGGRKVICGIRHLGMNLAKPFVQVCPNFAWKDAAEAKAVYATFLQDRFAMFRPRWIQVFSRTGQESEAGGSLTVVASSQAIRNLPLQDGAPEIRLENPRDDRYYDWYSESYDTFLAAFPDKQDWVQKNDLDLMMACRENGLLRLAYVGEDKVGIIAAERSPFLGYDGIYFVEILVVPEWRGRGIARILQQRFVEQCCGEGDFVWGLIDRGNDASLRTALSNGRKVVRGEAFLEV